MNRKKSNQYLQNGSIQDGIVVLILGIALAAYSLVMFYTTSVQTEWKMSPYLFPLLISVFTVLLSISLLADGKREVASVQPQADKTEGSGQLKKVFTIVAMAVVYYVLLSFAGFIPATVLFLIAMFLYLGERRYWLIGVLSVVTTGAIYALFGILLNVRLP